MLHYKLIHLYISSIISIVSVRIIKLTKGAKSADLLVVTSQITTGSKFCLQDEDEFINSEMTSLLFSHSNDNVMQ